MRNKLTKFLTSECPPKGMRQFAKTWKYAACMLLAFILGIGNVWAELTAHTPGVYEKTTDKGGYGATIVTVSSRDYEVYGFSYNSSGTKPQILWAGTSTNNASATQVLCSNLSTSLQEIAGWISMSTAGKSSTYSMPSSTEFAASSVGSTGLYQMKLQGHSFTIKVKGYDQFSFLGNDNNGDKSKGKYLQVTINGADSTKDVSNSTTVRRWTLNPSTTYTIVITGLGSSNEHIDAFSLRLPACQAPTTAFSEGAYTVGESALALSSLISGNNSDGAITYVVKTDGGTGASIAAGSFTATTAGTATITATQAADATHNKCEKIIDFNVVVTASSCAATIPGDISKGALTAGEITLTADGSAESGDIWYWQDAADGTATNLGTGATKNVNTAGTYYIRSYDTAGDCWSAAKSIEVTAEELLEHYAITYNNGAYGTGEIAGGEKVEGVAFTLSSDRFTRAGYVQVGWALTDGGAKAYELGGSYTTDAAQEFFPVWAETSTYVASFACGATAPAGWTFSNAGFDSDSKATADYVCTFTANELTAPGNNGMDADAVAFAKNTDAIATYDLGAATTVTALNVTLYGGSSSAFNETIEYLGADGSTVKKEYVNSLGAGNWAANNISKTEIVDGVRYIRIHGASKWVVMSAFSVTYVDLVTKYDLTFAKNGGSGTDMATLKYAENAVVTLPSCSFTPPDDHVFDGWAVTKTASGDAVTVTKDGDDYKFTMPAEAVTATAQWATISDFDVKFFQGYGDPDVQIGTTQTVSTGNFAVAPADPTRTGFAFLGWSYDGTEAHIVDVAAYGITAATNFTAMWKAVWTVTFDGAGDVEVENGEKVASPNSPVMAGKVFQGWYNGENKYDFSAAVAGNLALTSKWADADPNHYVYAYNDDFHFDGVVYKTPDGKTKDPEAAEASNVALATNPYTLFSGASGITSIVASNGIYDYKKGAGTKHITAYLKLKADDATSNVVFTIASGYTAVLKLKMNGYSSNATISLKKGDDAVTPSGTQEGTAEGKNYGEHTYNLAAGEYKLTTANKTLYISHIDLEAEAIPAKTVTYKAGEGTGSDVVDAAATEVADVPSTFTAPTGKVFNGWKDETNADVEVGAIVSNDMTLTAQWIAVYAVTFNMNGHGDAIDPQDIKEGAKATKPADPSESGWDFGGWFTDNGTFEVPFDFNTLITAATPLYAKWTADPCPDKKSIVKAVMTSTSTATVTGYNDNEYAGGYIINNLADGDNAFAYDFGEGSVTGYKLKGSGSAIFATLAKGGFEAGDKVVFAVTKKAGDNKLAVYAAKDKNNVLKLAEIDVADAGIYEYKLKAADIAAIEAAGADYKSIGSYRGDYNPYIYSVELKGCRSWAVMHTLTFMNIDGTATIAAEPLEEGAYASTVAPTAPKITLKRFLGWAEATDGTPVELASYTITEDKTLYAVYEDIVCPSSGTVYKFEIKDELPSENLPTSTDKDMSSYITATGDGYLTYTATADNKATINSDGTIQLKDQTAAYLKVELECALAAGDQIRAHVTNNPIRVQVGTTYDSNKDLILAKNAYEFVAITSAMEGKQVLYITRSSNGNANLADFEIYRPAKYDVSFNMMGHGSAIADLEDVVEGSKIAAPSPAPTDVDYSFAGWYKENTLENEWDFDVDVVDDNITLYAKWLDKSDATLKSLKYGSTEIELQAGVYTYAVELPSLTTSVPALTAETSNPNASAVITNDDAFDGEGNASSTVEVTPEKEGAAHQTYTVNFTKLPSMPLLDVVNSIVWDFANAGTQNNTFTDEVLANFPGVTNDATFSAQTLKASGAKIKDGYLQGTPILFHATKAGLLRVEFANTGGGTRPYRYLVVNGERTAYKSNNTTHVTTAWIEVPAGDVTIEGECVEDANGACTSDNLNFYKIEFLAENTARARTLVVGNLGTTCIENACIVRGAEIYEIKGKNDIGKIVFDQLDADEVLEAGHPYVMVAKEANIRFFNTIADPATEPYDAGNGLIGTFEQKEFAAGEASEGLYFFKDHALWAAKETGMTIPAYRCYLNMNAVGTFSGGAPAPGRRRITMDVHGQNAATGIGNVQGDEVQSTKVLINGELFILRGEKMYDATGRMVK